MEISKAELRRYLGQIAQRYADNEDDRTLRTRVMQDFDRLLQGLNPVDPFYAWDALGVLRYEVIPATDRQARAHADVLYAAAEEHYMEEIRSCHPTSTSVTTEPPLR